MKLASLLNKGIEYSFYALFLLVPLVFAGNTSELFEFNKMWLTFGLAIFIGFFWFSKMLLTKQFNFKRTVLDIPILLFLISQVISTVISLDHHVSLWGYYSRWNGGLLSTITYIFLYYAFVSNFFGDQNDTDGKTVVKKSLLVSLVSGLIVVFWALPSHFGHDPTCLVFRGHLDVSCWTADFQPKIRIFGPLGQPDWLAGYLGVLLPISGAFILQSLKETKKFLDPKLIFYSVMFVLFYVSLLYTGSRSGILATIVSLLAFFGGYVYLNRKGLGFLKNRFTGGFIALVLALSFFVGVQLPIVSKISWSEISGHLHKAPVATTNQTSAATAPSMSALDSGGSSSLQIRKIVWRGAIDVWKANPLFGSGVETFAFAYYKYRPIEHNRVSEWNFLYNKAHNEYLNYLATTGAFGLLTYLSFIGLFGLFIKTNVLNLKFKRLNFLKANEKWDTKDPLILALGTSFLSILIINFFGFSVVILNIYLFLIPAFTLISLGMIKHTEAPRQSKVNYVSYAQWLGIGALGIVAIFLIYTLAKFWVADTKYALGFNYNHAGEYQTAYPLLHEAVKMRPEPVFEDEMSVNDSIIAAGLAAQNSTESAALVESLAKEALDTSSTLTTNYPNNLVFWKSRVRILYTLAKVDPRFYPLALDAIKKAADLAPTDASILYNLGVLYGQNGDSTKAVEVLEKTISYKPDYTEAHFALAIFYHDLSVDKKGAITNASYHGKAIDQLNFLLRINPGDVQTKQYLDVWSKER